MNKRTIVKEHCKENILGTVRETTLFLYQNVRDDALEKYVDPEVQDAENEPTDISTVSTFQNNSSGNSYTFYNTPIDSDEDEICH